MRISDWSADVCSSDLLGVEPGEHAPERAAARLRDALAPADLEPVHIESGRIDERQVHVRHAVEEYPVAPLAQMFAHIQIDADVGEDVDELELEGDRLAHVRGDTGVEAGELVAEGRQIGRAHV